MSYCKVFTKKQRKPNHPNWTRKDIESIHSSTLRTLVMLYRKLREECTSPLGVPIDVSAEWVMEKAECCQRTAYDYKAALEALIGLR
jgi:hypothetical protein